MSAGPVVVGGGPLRDAAVDGHAPGELHTVVGVGDPHGPGVRCIQVGTREWEALVVADRANGADGDVA
ncbi:hypothetical protein SAMN05443575_1333 [Jatrophihabitans endophyticus]|uniref:Uncharacterized protein n=1 Tax=Jatrophihabitans endophyticus TaxID=1206085 RepID=A0A1M5GYE1_9ACTN|nr:hypothetical protein [Jatrophihabitans endophyticus]SHG08751.1 hypothetical protein SAMN05443575_1333 [Jatrophihabitans endophyticus]